MVQEICQQAAVTLKKTKRICRSPFAVHEKKRSFHGPVQKHEAIGKKKRKF